MNTQETIGMCNLTTAEIDEVSGGVLHAIIVAELFAIGFLAGYSGAAEQIVEPSMLVNF